MTFCEHCGTELSPEAPICPKCGQPIRGKTIPSTVQTAYNPYKNPTTAALMAIIGGIFGFMGIGHIYAGKIGKGIFILIAGIVLFIVGIVTLFIVVGIPLLIIYAV